MIGAALAPLGLFLASVATKIWHIYLSQGFLFGLGCGFVFCPAMALPSQWFKKNRALATGLAAGGSGIGSVVISPLTEKLFETIGYRNALRVQGALGFSILILATALAFSNVDIKGHCAQQNQKKLGYRDLLSNTDFFFLLAYCVLCYFGFFGPFFLAPQYAAFLGHNAADGLFTSVLWQCTLNYESYIAYCVLNGLTGGAFVSAIPVVVADIIGVENIQQGIGMCYMATFFGNLLGPPIAGKLLQQHGWTAAIQFPGAITLLSAVIVLCLRMKRSKGKIIMKL
ncbi:major facilitator superfamily domain-containing protein [Absidia repens]|uniref:Major facilitator superfamily domain-containing protein n=1 Tax=Absidia repens TaxID=90262 RepID=A0A1X2IEV6_9FUNG|nr:major facilitator superfamily domain-containing protein [Absidia repens]